MLFWILAGLAVLVLNIYLPASIYYLQSETLRSHVGSRDDDPVPSIHAARARRSLANLLENIPIFLTLGVLALVVEATDIAQAVLGAQMFVIARTVYMFLYVFAVPWVRSLTYGVGLVGCIIMALALV